MFPPWTIYLLGRFEVRRENISITHFRTRQTAGLLAYLAYFQDRSHPREVLIDLFWPEAGIESGRSRLNIALSSLRQLLTTDSVPLFLGNHFEVRLNPEAGTSDLTVLNAELARGMSANTPSEKIARLSSVLESSRGELLPGFYDTWIPPEQERCAALLAEGAEALARAYESAGQLAQATSTLQRALTQTPDSLPLRAALVRLQSPLKSLEGAQGTGRVWRSALPTVHNRFIGRLSEQDQLVALLESDARLLTLIGPGGIGKSRLALEVTNRLAAHYQGRVVFLGLSGLTQDRLLPSLVVDALRSVGAIEAEAVADPLETLVNALADAPSLLVFDNFEQLSEEAGQFLLNLLERAPAVRCLVTSRRLLHLTSERVVPLGPLSSGESADPNTLLTYEGVQLFLDRALMLRPGLPLTGASLTAVARLCNLLEGSPLALEIAAARVNVLSPARMCAEIAHRREWLQRNHPDIPERHHSLWASMEWSYNLLSSPQQELLTALSVFRNGWTLDAAAEVCELSLSSLLDRLQALVECSLVQSVDGRDGELRFLLLESLRDFAAARLEPERAATIAARHEAYYTGFARQAAEALQGQEEGTWLQRLEEEQGNFQAIFTRGGGHALAVSLHRYWLIRGYAAEGLPWLLALLNAEVAPTPAWRGDAANAAGILSWSVGDLAGAHHWFRESLARLDRPSDQGRALNNLGLVATRQGELEKACDYFEESLSLYRSLEAREQCAMVLSNLGGTLIYRKEYAKARTVLEESLAIQYQAGEPFSIASALHNLAEATCLLGERQEAARLLRECLSLRRELKDDSAIKAMLQTVALIAASGPGSDQSSVLTARLLHAALCRVGASAADREEYEELCSHFEKELGTGRYQVARDAGEPLSKEETLALADEILQLFAEKI